MGVPAGEPMRVLIIGGTRFVGRHLAQEALARGHELVLFNRGHTNPELFPEAAKVHGDRTGGGLAQLAGEAFDIVFDTGAYHPDDVAATAAIAAGVAHYSLVSSVSVYRDPVARHADESAAVWIFPGQLPQEFSTPEEYGALKAASEMKATAIYGNRALIIRPGLIVGPHDYTDRLTSWLRRLSTRDVVLAGEADQPVQLIDVRDLAAWMMHAAEARLSGVFNAVGPAESTTFGELLMTAAEVCGVAPQVVWAGDRFVTAQQLALPLWVPRSDHAFFELANARALDAGLALRPLARTLADVKAWDDSRPPDEGPALPAAREDALLSEV